MFSWQIIVEFCLYIVVIQILLYQFQNILYSRAEAIFAAYNKAIC